MGSLRMETPRAISPKGETWHPPPVSDHSASETEVTASSWHPLVPTQCLAPVGTTVGWVASP